MQSIAPCESIWASVKVGDTLPMLIWRETFNGIVLAVILINYRYVANLYQSSSLIRIFMPKCIISEYITQKMYRLRYEIVYSVTKL